MSADDQMPTADDRARDLRRSIGSSGHGALSPVCPCGTLGHHRVARRTTADGRQINIGSDGSMWMPLGLPIRGLGAPRTRYGSHRRADAVRLMMDSLSLFNLAEIPALIRAAEATSRYSYASEDARRADAVRRAGRALTRRWR